MTQWPYFRDVWVLGPPDNGYPGAFPRGLINKIKRKWWGKDRLWLFSGSFVDKGGTMVDIKPELNPTYIANCEELPLEDESYDFVMADPPYSKEEAMSLYGTTYPSLPKILNEMARVCKPGGHALFLHRLIPQRHPVLNGEFKRLNIVGLVGVCLITGFCNMRALTVWKKDGKLELDFE